MALAYVTSILLVSVARDNTHECVQWCRHHQLTKYSCGQKVEPASKYHPLPQPKLASIVFKDNFEITQLRITDVNKMCTCICLTTPTSCHYICFLRECKANADSDSMTRNVNELLQNFFIYYWIATKLS